MPLIPSLHKKNYYFKKKVTRNEICFQNYLYIKFTKDPKQTKILIFQKYWCRPLFWKNKNRLVYLKNKSWLIHAIFFVFFFMQFFCFCFLFFYKSISVFASYYNITNQHLLYMYLYRCSLKKMIEYTFLMGNSLHTGSTWYNW